MAHKQSKVARTHNKFKANCIEIATYNQAEGKINGRRYNLTGTQQEKAISKKQKELQINRQVYHCVKSVIDWNGTRMTRNSTH